MFVSLLLISKGLKLYHILPLVMLFVYSVIGEQVAKFRVKTG